MPAPPEKPIQFDPAWAAPTHEAIRATPRTAALNLMESSSWGRTLTAWVQPCQRDGRPGCRPERALALGGFDGLEGATYPGSVPLVRIASERPITGRKSVNCRVGGGSYDTGPHV